MLHVFVDANVYLALLDLSNDDIAELSKILTLVARKKVRIYITSQVRDEVIRNRTNRIQTALKLFSYWEKSLQIPRMLQRYPEADQVRSTFRDFSDAYRRLIEAAQPDIENSGLKADNLFSDLVRAVGVIDASQPLITAADLRRLRGNPPGKAASIGDQLNWETLLEVVPQGSDLHLISRDGDFYSVLPGDQPDAFLVREWRDAKGAEFRAYKDIKRFLSATFAEFDFAAYSRHSLDVDELVHARTFVQVHSNVGRLAEFVNELSANEAQSLADAALRNYQIRWLLDDRDVSDFYHELVRVHSVHLSPYQKAAVDELLIDSALSDDELDEAVADRVLGG